MILAFGTRKVKIKGMNDSKYVAAAVYVTSIVLAVTTVSTYTLMDYVNVYPAVVGLGFLLGTTVILGLVFVPRVSMYIGKFMIMCFMVHVYHKLYRWWVCTKTEMERVLYSILLLLMRKQANLSVRVKWRSKVCK